MSGSHGTFDLVAIKIEPNYRVDGEIRLIQVKSGRTAKKELAKLEPLREKYNGVYNVRVELL